MRCKYPIDTWVDREGKQVFKPPKEYLGMVKQPEKASRISCGKCLPCRKNQAMDWTTRNYVEMLTHDVAWMITLTYNNENLPKYGSLDYNDSRYFLHKLRAYQRRNYKRGFRFFGVGEYGGKSGRAHYHIIAYGLPIKDIRKSSRSGYYSSETITKIWNKGHVTIIPVEIGTIRYTTQYCYKKLGGSEPRLGVHFEVENGEIIAMQEQEIQPEKAFMSQRPAIGIPWFQDNWKSIIKNEGKIDIDGKLLPAPKIFMEKLKEIDEYWADELARDRLKSAQKTMYAELDNPIFSQYQENKIRDFENYIEQKMLKEQI